MIKVSGDVEFKFGANVGLKINNCVAEGCDLGEIDRQLEYFGQSNIRLQRDQLQFCCELDMFLVIVVPMRF